MTPHDISVVIPTLNEADCIEGSIRSAFEAGAGQVTVCDGGSDDRTCEIAQRAGAEVIESESGRGNQLMHGASASNGQVILFLHADNLIEKDAFRTLCQLFDSNPNDQLWGGFRQRIDSPNPIFRLIETGNAARIRFRGMPFGDQAIFVTRDLYDVAGGIRPLPLMEDVDLSRRLRRHAWPTLVDSRVKVDARRWQRRGIVRQTLMNWTIQTAHALGVSEEKLATWYR